MGAVTTIGMSLTHEGYFVFLSPNIFLTSATAIITVIESIGERISPCQAKPILQNRAARSSHGVLV